MEKSRSKEIRNLVIVISFALFGGFSFYYWGSPGQQIKDSLQLNSETSENDDTWDEGLNRVVMGSVAESYIRAYQTGNCAEVIRLTWWMQERILFVKDQQLSQAEIDKAMQDLCTGIQRDRTKSHLLQIEGVSDQYILTPQSKYSILGADRGVDGLSKSVSERVWVRIDYPNQAIALKNGNSKPIKSLVVGINLSHDGYIIKSGIRGNIDVDMDRILYWK